MNVVRGDEPEAKVLRDLRQDPVALALFLDAVVVQLDEEIFRAENVPIFGGGLLCLVDIVRLNRRVYFARETAAQSNQSRRMLRQQLFVDSRSVMKSIKVRRRDQFDQVAITGVVLR